MNMRKNLLEWIVFGISLILITAVVGLLVVEEIRSPERPPNLRVTLGEAVPGGDGTYRLPVTVRNEGGQTAEQARLEVTLQSGGREIERAELTMAFVPRDSSRRGWVILQHDPRCCEVSAAAVGFNQP